MLISLSKVSHNRHVFYFQRIFAVIFYHSDGIVKLIPDFNNWVIVLINETEEFCDKQIFFFSLIWVGQNIPLMHVALSK